MPLVCARQGQLTRRLGQIPLNEFLSLVSARRGHFQLESGHHGELWLDLDSLFADPRRITPFVSDLSEAIGQYDVSCVCGPLLGGAFLAQLIAHELGIDFCFTERVRPSDTSGLYTTRYLLPAAFHDRVRGQRIAMVDDVMSAGSSLRGTFEELKDKGAVPVVAGALLLLGSRGADFFAENEIVVEAVARDEYQLWPPNNCPLCESGVPLESLK